MANDAKIESVWYNPMKKNFSENGPIPDYQASDFGEILEILGLN